LHFNFLLYLELFFLPHVGGGMFFSKQQRSTK